jgi:hypothetical protein
MDAILRQMNKGRRKKRQIIAFERIVLLFVSAG